MSSFIYILLLCAIMPAYGVNSPKGIMIEGGNYSNKEFNVKGQPDQDLANNVNIEERGIFGGLKGYGKMMFPSSTTSHQHIVLPTPSTPMGPFLKNFSSLSISSNEIKSCFTIGIKEFKKKGCMVILPSYGNISATVRITIEDKVIGEKIFSLEDLTVICFPLPMAPVIMLCPRLYNIQLTNGALGFCSKLSVQVIQKAVIVVQFGCASVSSSGLIVLTTGIPDVIILPSN